MGHQKVLSSKFNMSLGFIPVIISILLCEVITQDISIYIGAGVGVLLYLYSWRRRGARIPQIILCCTTGMLLLLSITTLFTTSYCPRFMFPFTLEISAVIPPLIIFLNRKRFLNYHAAQAGQCCKQLFAQSAEAAIVSARVVLIISFLHFDYFPCHSDKPSFRRHYTLHLIQYSSRRCIYPLHFIQPVRYFLFQYSHATYDIRTGSQ